MDNFDKPPVIGRVALIFPPLVETNFGCYYPSTAVLAGFLDAFNIGSVQLDLNEDFASWLLEPENLERMGNGDFGSGLTMPPESMPAVSARLLARYRERLFNERGAHLFREDSAPEAYLLNILAKPFRIDVPISELSIEKLGSMAVSGIYRDFFKSTGPSNLPERTELIGISIPVGPQLAPSLLLAD